jgi:hypothetical protein
MWGGSYGWPPVYNDAWIYDYSDNTWVIDPNTIKPNPRSNVGLAESSMDATSEIVLFGGTTTGGYPDDTWLFGGGEYIYGSHGNRLYEDQNNNGNQDVGELGLANIDVNITNRHGNVQTFVTDANGDFIAQLPWGNTTVDVDETDPDFNSNFVQTQGTDPYGTNIAIGLFALAIPNGYYNPQVYVIISGNVKYSNNNPIEGVEIAFSNSGLTATTDATGYYERYITKGWHGTATPSMSGFHFTPSSYTYSGIQTNAPNQDYIGKKDGVSISGYVKDGANNPIEGVAVAFSNGGATVITNATGYYSTSVTNGWGGTSTATKDDWSFTPLSYTYPAVTTNLTDQAYVGTDLTLAVEDITALPTEFMVLPAYPNPFNPSTTIRYGLDTDSYVTINIYDISGQLISTLVNTNETQGWYSVIWNGTNSQGTQVPAGLYISRITSDNEVRTTKLMLLK